MAVSSRLLEVKNLETEFLTRRTTVRAVDTLSFHIEKGETVGMVGESGCGKSVTALSILRLVDCPPGKIRAAQVLFEGVDLFKMDEKEMGKIRGNKIGMIFQEPMTSLNPLFTIGDQIGEVVKRHQGSSRTEATNRAVEMLRWVGIPSPERRIHEYPHQFSGGMRQRVMIAMALCCGPKLLIADEPTTALDVTIQAQILELMMQLKKESDMAVLLITHDFGVVSELADRVLVMYAGKIVESALAADLLDHPIHPYTEGLLRCVPDLEAMERRLQTIPGVVPDPARLPRGCRFRPRCSFAFDPCSVEEPPLIVVQDRHLVSCWLAAGHEKDRVM